MLTATSHCKQRVVSPCRVLQEQHNNVCVLGSSIVKSTRFASVHYICSGQYLHRP